MTSCNDTNVTAVKVYFPLEDPIQVYQNRVKPCPDGFTAGFYWYGGKRRGPGRPPRWVETVLSTDSPSEIEETVLSTDLPSEIELPETDDDTGILNTDSLPENELI